MDSTTNNNNSSNKEATTILETLHGVIKSQQDLIKELISVNIHTNMMILPALMGNINRQLQQPEIDPKHQQEFNDLFREKLFAQIKNDHIQAKE